MFKDPINRRALGKSLRNLTSTLILIVGDRNSCRMRYAGIPTTLRFQHFDVLFRDAVQGNRIRSTYGSRVDRVWDKLFIHAYCAQMDRPHREAKDHALECTWHDYRIDTGQHLILL